jgi:type I restriction enzyme M protein
LNPLNNGGKNREESEVAWKVPIQTIIDRNYDLDIKNPNKKVEEVTYDRKEIIKNIENSFNESLLLLNELKAD